MIMACFIHKITKDRGQYRVTLPKEIVEEIGIDKARAVEIWSTEESVIHIMEYCGKQKGPNRVPGCRPETHR